MADICKKVVDLPKEVLLLMVKIRIWVPIQVNNLMGPNMAIIKEVHMVMQCHHLQVKAAQWDSLRSFKFHLILTNSQDPCQEASQSQCMVMVLCPRLPLTRICSSTRNPSRVSFDKNFMILMSSTLIST